MFRNSGSGEGLMQSKEDLSKLWEETWVRHSSWAAEPSTRKGWKRGRRGAWGRRQEPDGREPTYHSGEWGGRLHLFLSGRVPSYGLEWGSNIIWLRSLKWCCIEVRLQETILSSGPTVLSPICLCLSRLIKSSSCNDFCTKSQTKPCQDKPQKHISVAFPQNSF